jgi:sulfur carrier protein ThiS
MKLHVGLVGTLKKYAKPGLKPEGFIMDAPDGAMVGDVVRILGIPENELFAFTLNSERLEKSDKPVREGDKLTLYSIVAGG